MSKQVVIRTHEQDELLERYYLYEISKEIKEIAEQLKENIINE